MRTKKIWSWRKFRFVQYYELIRQSGMTGKVKIELIDKKWFDSLEPEYQYKVVDFLYNVEIDSPVDLKELD